VSRSLRWLADQLPALVIFAAFIVLWQLAVSFLEVREYLLPSPASVLRAMFGDEIPWGRHIWVTAGPSNPGVASNSSFEGVGRSSSIGWCNI